MIDPHFSHPRSVIGALHEPPLSGGHGDIIPLGLLSYLGHTLNSRIDRRMQLFHSLHRRH